MCAMPSTRAKRLGIALETARRGPRPLVRHAAIVRLEAWGPLLLRGVACGLGLLGLAGIGMAASRAPELAASTTPQLGLRLAELALTGAASEVAAAPEPPGLEPGAAAPPPRPDAGAPPPAPAAREASASTGCPRPARGAATEPRRAAGPKARAPVVLNRATVTELQGLPSVGAKRAAAIVELRARLGSFRRVTDLLRIKGIGPRTLERMLPHLELGEPPAEGGGGKAQP